MNIFVEVDIYVYVNLICVMGFCMFNGFGGLVDFLRNVKYFIMYIFLICFFKMDFYGVLCIVFMCIYIDQIEYDLDIVVIEVGFVDVCGLVFCERVCVIIDKCVYDVYKFIFKVYFEKVEFECLCKGMGYEFYLFFNSFDMYKVLLEEGSMCKVKFW